MAINSLQVTIKTNLFFFFGWKLRYCPEILHCNIVSRVDNAVARHRTGYEKGVCVHMIPLFERSEFLIATCKKKKTDRLSVLMFG